MGYLWVGDPQPGPLPTLAYAVASGVGGGQNPRLPYF